MTDNLDAVYLQHYTALLNGDSPAELRALLEAGLSGPFILGSASPLATVGREVRMLDDGRVGGIWAIEGNEAFFILEHQDGTWLVDETIDVIDE